MAKLSRFTQLLFGSTASANQMSQFGSLAAGTPNRYSGATITPALVQNLTQFLEGWSFAIQGANSPAIEDMNALFYLCFYQLCYLMQEGVPEWDSATTYFTGSIVNSAGVLYVSLANNNLNNVVSNASFWSPYGQSQVISINPATQSPYTMLANQSGFTFEINSANGACQMNLPVPAAALNFTFKDIAGLFNVSALTLHRNAAESIEGVAADYVSSTSYWGRTLFCDGTNWYFNS
jgi:hypothetical protein